MKPLVPLQGDRRELCSPQGLGHTVRTGELRKERKSHQGVKTATGMIMGAVPPPVLTKLSQSPVTARTFARSHPTAHAGM